MHMYMQAWIMSPIVSVQDYIMYVVCTHITDNYHYDDVHCQTDSSLNNCYQLPACTMQ